MINPHLFNIPPQSQQQHSISLCCPANLMEVLVGPASYVSPPCMFIKEEDGGVSPGEIRNRLGSGFLGKSSEDFSDSDNSSSIGAPGDSDGEDEEEEEEDGEVSSQGRGSGGLASLDDLEESLPIKRGLSNHYTGKSKSFGNLSDVSLTSISIKDLEKPENALNKRRRLLIANKWARKSFYSSQNPKSMPILASLNEDDDEICNSKQMDQEGQRLRRPFALKSQSCFALADLQEEEEEEEEDDDNDQ